jgi:hypothetical protein
VDLDWSLVQQGEENARQAGVEDRVKFLEQDFFNTDLGQATVITTYLLPFVMLRLRPALLELKPGTRIVSHDFDFGDWQPDQKTSVRKNVFLWIVPARAAGRWQARLELPPIERLLELIDAALPEVSAHAPERRAVAGEAKLVGDRLSFVVVDSTDRENEGEFLFDGRVSGDVIEGEATRGVGAGAA